MNSPGRMTAQELRASIALSSAFGLFAILPVFVIYAEGLPGGQT